MSTANTSTISHLLRLMPTCLRWPSLTFSSSSFQYCSDRRRQSLQMSKTVCTFHLRKKLFNPLRPTTILTFYYPI